MFSYNAFMKLSSVHKERFVKKLEMSKGHAVGFRVDEVTLPEGKRARREYLTHPGAVAAFAVDRNGKILLVKQYRYPVHEFTLEIPAGKLAAGEQPLACVRRELEEEAGVRAKTFQKLLSFWPTAAFSDEVIHIYLATGLVETQAHPDEDEYLELLRVSPRQVETFIRQGKIRDSKTLIAYLAWKNLTSTTL
jgi:ADP-ribose pyrophosphatase